MPVHPKVVVIPDEFHIYSTLGTIVDESASMSLSADQNEEEEEHIRHVMMMMENHSLDAKYGIDYLHPLGTGKNTIVRRAVECKTGNSYAVKSVDKLSYPYESAAMRGEAKLLSRLDHPHILQVHEECEDAQSYHIVLELCPGGEVYHLVTAETKRNKTVRSNVAVRIVQQVVQAVQYCHSRNVVHRDIKLENILLLQKPNESSIDAAVEIRLADFGIATYHRRGDAPLTDYVGSPTYVAPEVLNRSYDRACDIWSIGVMTYALLCGVAPFSGTTKQEVYAKIQSAPLEFTHPAWQAVNHHAKDFIQACLQKDPRHRPTAPMLARHAWIATTTRSCSVPTS
eukprot:scaffold8298_cov166-Amphora_coffeaeformis.AAC.1